MSGNNVQIRKLVGLEFSGATLTSFDDLRPGDGTLGQSVWGPAELLRDLELRLGLPTPALSEALRVTRWAARMRSAEASMHFYARSFARDPLGTAQAVLTLRDALVEAGWAGQSIDGAGARIDAIVELELLREPEVPLGTADRVARLARSLTGAVRFYDELILADEQRLWPRVWHSVFAALEKCGTRVRVLEDEVLPGAPTDTDLGRVQAALRGGPSVDGTSLRGDAPAHGTSLRGDGSLVLLQAETSIEAGRAAAAVLAKSDAAATVVVREGDATDLENGLTLQHEPTLGLSSTSVWRAMLQLLPLALELAFAPKDPQRVLELLTLPAGPFQGAVGRAMARALRRAPGIGGKPWEEKKERILEPREEVLSKLSEWLEQPGADRNLGASKEELLQVVARVRQWLLTRVPHAPDDPTLLAAIRQCDGLGEALNEDARGHFDLVAVRRLLELVAAGARLEITPETAGRVAHVSAPSALRVARETVLWWSFVHERGVAPSLPFRHMELHALQRTGVSFPDPREVLAERAHRARRVALTATRRLILVVPRHRAGQGLAPHPLWDEVVARMNLDAESRRRVSFEVGALLDTRQEEPLHVDRNEVAPLALPAGHAQWNLSVSTGPDWSRHSPASLTTLFGCPLRYAFEHWADFDSEGTGLPPLYLLSGTLGHRLIEELHERAAFEVEPTQLRALAEEHTARLIEREGALLLRPGKAHEHEQIHRQLVDAACTLGDILRRNGLRIHAVEEAFEVPWSGGVLSGRLDILAVDANDRRVIIDVKWGKSSYVKHLSEGTALQLAAYRYALRAARKHAWREETQAPPLVGQPQGASPSSTDIDAGYFSLKAQRLLVLRGTDLKATDPVNGASLDETWRRVERTLPLVQEQVSRGQLAVTGVRESLPLLETLPLEESEHHQHYATPREGGCQYCMFDALCGRRWEQLL